LPKLATQQNSGRAGMRISDISARVTEHYPLCHWASHMAQY